MMEQDSLDFLLDRASFRRIKDINNFFELYERVLDKNKELDEETTSRLTYYLAYQLRNPNLIKGKEELLNLTKVALDKGYTQRIERDEMAKLVLEEVVGCLGKSPEKDYKKLRGDK